jgi:HEAT repeat protein
MTDDSDVERAADLRKRTERDAPDTVDVDAVASLLDADDVDARRNAAEAIARLSTGATDRVVALAPRLVGRLADESPEVRSSVAMALAAIAEHNPERVVENVDSLTDRLDDAEDTVRASATLTLSNLATAAPEQVAAAIDSDAVESLVTDENRDVRSNALELVIELTGRGYEGVLTDSLRARVLERLDDDAWFVRERACLAVSVVGDECDRERLRTTAESDPNDIVRETAGEALERLDERR